MVRAIDVDRREETPFFLFTLQFIILNKIFGFSPVLFSYHCGFYQVNSLRFLCLCAFSVYFPIAEKIFYRNVYPIYFSLFVPIFEFNLNHFFEGKMNGGKSHKHVNQQEEEDELEQPPVLEPETGAVGGGSGTTVTYEETLIGAEGQVEKGGGRSIHNCSNK